eukprot:6834394-Prymnesium_polylepis.1
MILLRPVFSDHQQRSVVQQGFIVCMRALRETVTIANRARVCTGWLWSLEAVHNATMCPGPGVTASYTRSLETCGRGSKRSAGHLHQSHKTNRPPPARARSRRHMPTQP